MGAIGSRARKIDFYIKQGSDWSTAFTIMDSNGIVDLTGSSFAGQIRKTRLSENASASFTFSVNLTTNKVTVSLSDTVTGSLEAGEDETDSESKYVYDFEWTRSDGTVDRFQEGQIIVSSGATR